MGWRLVDRDARRCIWGCRAQGAGKMATWNWGPRDTNASPSGCPHPQVPIPLFATAQRRGRDQFSDLPPSLSVFTTVKFTEGTVPCWPHGEHVGFGSIGLELLRCRFIMS